SSGQAGLDMQDLLGSFRGCSGRIAEKLELVFKVSTILAARVCHLRTFAQVELGSGKVQPALVNDGDHLGGIAKLLVSAHGEERIGAELMQAGDFFGEVDWTGNLADALELWLHCCNACGFDG